MTPVDKRRTDLRIVYVVGARPNFVKMAGAIAQLRRRLPDSRHALIHSGQHYDRMMSELFLQELGVPEPDHMLGVGSGSDAVQTARVERIEPVLLDERTDLVIVPGDVNDARRDARGGEAWDDRRAPRGGSPQLRPHDAGGDQTDRCRRVLRAAVPALRRGDREPPRGGHSRRSHVLRRLQENRQPRRDGAALPAARGITAIRPRARWLCARDAPSPSARRGPLLGEAMHQIGEVARKIPVLFPVHPRTRRMLEDIDVRPGIQVVDPVGYLDFLALEADAAAVLTDSGGAQAETTHLGVPRFRLRDDTKRPVTVRAGTNTLLGLSPQRIADILPGFRENGRVPLSPPPGWDGRAAERVADVIERLTELPADSSAAVTP